MIHPAQHSTPLALALASAAVFTTLPGHASAQRRRAPSRAAAAVPVPQSPSPITLTVRPLEGSLHWAFDLENTSRAPVQVVADRRLLRLELAPSGAVTAPTPTRGRRARAPRTVTCRAAMRPATNEQAARTTIQPGEHYTEGFDVRELCGLRLPPGFVPGASLTARYGFADARGFSHAIALDDQDPPVVDIAAASPLVIPGDASSWPPRGGDADRGDARLRVTVAGDVSAPRVADVRVTTRVRVQGHYAIWLFNRPGQVRFELTSPRGASISCRRGFREYNPVRDFFVRIQPGQGLTETVSLASLCPPEQFTTPGIYRGQAVFDTRASGERFGLQSFTGRAGSDYFFVRIESGAQPGPYQRLPVEDPFAPPTTARDAASNRP